MAHDLTVRRWLAGIAAVCLLVAAALLPPGGKLQTVSPWRVGPRPNPEMSYRQRLRIAADNLHLLDLRDSLLRIAARRPAADLLVLTAPSLPAGTDTVVRVAAAAFAADAAPLPGTPRVPVIVAVIDGGATRLAPYRFTYLLPSGAGNGSCLAIRVVDSMQADRLEKRPTPRTFFGWESPVQVFGPCAFVQRFGEPGPAVTTWLAAHQYAPIIYPAWLMDRTGMTRLFPDLRWLAGSGWNPRSWGSFLRENLPLAFVACAAGDREACSSATMTVETNTLSPLTTYRDRVRLPGVVSGERRWYAINNSALGRSEPSYLSDLVVELGPERFATFWRSDAATVQAAFREAYGMEIGEWTMRWAREQIGTPPRGAVLPPTAAAFSLALGGLFLIGAGWWVGRRQVS